MDKENKKLDIKTFKFEDFQNKIEEGADRVGFNTYQTHSDSDTSSAEYEDNIDDLGTGEEVNTDLIEDAPDAVEGNTDAIDDGSNNGVSTADLEEKLKELLKISKYIKGNDMQNIYNDIDKILQNPNYSQYLK
jgi:hypothetical protein